MGELQPGCPDPNCVWCNDFGPPGTPLMREISHLRAVAVSPLAWQLRLWRSACRFAAGVAEILLTGSTARG